MPIYTYDCPEDGVTDVFTRTVGPPFEMACPHCRGQMANVIAAPARVEVKRDWNEKANDYQRDPYTQAKAQILNHDRQEQEHQGTRPVKITEESIQVGAKGIYDSEHNPPQGPVLKTQALQRRIVAENRKKEE